MPEALIALMRKGDKSPEYVKKPGAKKEIKEFPPYLDYPLKSEDDDDG